MADRCTCSALRMAARRLTQIYDAALSSQSVTTPQYALLSRIETWEGEPPTMRQLSDRMGLDRTTLAHNLRPLERDGLVVVNADPSDRRIKRITLTTSGQLRHTACFPLWKAAQQRFEADFGPDRADELMRSLARLSRIPIPGDWLKDSVDAG